MPSAKFDVDITGFKNGIKEGQAVLKSLDAEMKVAEAEFKNTGNAEKLLADKTKTLTSQMNAQKSVMEQAQAAMKAMTDAGIEPTDAAYQRLNAQMLQAQAGMLETQNALNNLNGTQQQAAQSANQLSESVNGIGKKLSLDAVIGGIDKITSGLQNAAQKAVDLGQKLWDTIMDSASRADDTATMAEMYGIDLDTFMRMQKLVAGGMDTSVESILKAQTKFKKGVGDESKAVKEAMQELGISTKEYQKVAGESGQALVTKDVNKLFWEAGRAIMNLGDEYEKESKAQALFGKSWKELVPLFDSYASLEEYNAALADQTVNSEEAVRDLAALNDAVSKLEDSWKTLKDEMLHAIAPALEDAATALSGLLDAVTEYVKSDEGQELIKGLGEAVSGLFEDLKNIQPEEVVETFQSVFSGIVEGIQWISKNWGSVVIGLKAIGLAFVGLRVSSTILQFVQLLAGLKGLTIPGAAAPAVAAAGGGGTAGGTATATAVGGSTAGTYLTSLGGKAGELISGAGLLPMVLWDRFSNELNTGRAMRDGGDVIEGIKQDYSDLVENAKENVASFADNWDPNSENANVLAKLFGNVGTAIDEFFNGPEVAEDLSDKMTKEFSEKPIDALLEPTVPADAAEDISNQIGEVAINGTVYITGVDGSTIGVTGKGLWDEQTGKVLIHKNRRPKANGISYVPYDGYLATLHRGEMVVPAREVGSRNYSSNLYVESMIMNNGTDAEGLAAAMAAAQKRTMAGFGS